MPDNDEDQVIPKWDDIPQADYAEPDDADADHTDEEEVS